MLLRMYTRWAEQHGCKVELMEESAGEQAGVKSATILVKGDNAYGWLKTESGVHRLVRISPFDANARARRASRACGSIRWWTTPSTSTSTRAMSASTPIGLRAPAASTFNTTDSARASLPHPDRHRGRLPERTLAAQEPRDTAWQMPRARLYERELKCGKRRRWPRPRPRRNIGWGHQIRSYVLQPYQLVKDLRTGVESNAPDDVLNGDLDPFMEASLAQRITGAADQVQDID